MSAVIFIIFNGYGWSYTVTTCLTLVSFFTFSSSETTFALVSFFTFSSSETAFALVSLFTFSTLGSLSTSLTAFSLVSFFTFGSIFNSNFLNKFVYALSINTVSIVIKIESEVICITNFILINTWLYCID